VKTSNPKSILIVRLSAIGDVIMASSLIPALKQAYPEARLAWMTGEGNIPLLRHNPRLSKLVTWPTNVAQKALKERRYGVAAREFVRAVRAVREDHYDWVIDAQGLLKSGIWTRLARCDWRIGLGSREGSQYLMNQFVSRHSNLEKIGVEHRLLMEALGHPMKEFRMDIVVPPEVLETTRALLVGAGVRKPFVVLAPFTTRPQKHWFNDRWTALAARLSTERGLQPVVLGGPADAAVAAQLCSGVNGMVSLAGRTSLIQAAAVMQDAALVVGVDTGLAHLGIALRRPTLALFGSTRPYLDPDFEHARVLYEPMACSPCRRRPTCGGEFTCMRSHTVERVFDATKHVVGGAL
jgi:heptosyltransferase-1